MRGYKAFLESRSSKFVRQLRRFGESRSRTNNQKVRQSGSIANASFHQHSMRGGYDVPNVLKLSFASRYNISYTTGRTHQNQPNSPIG